MPARTAEDRALVAAVAALTERPAPAPYSLGEINRAAALVRGEVAAETDAERAAVAAYHAALRGQA